MLGKWQAHWLIEEAWQLFIQPGLTAHNQASYMGPGTLRDTENVVQWGAGVGGDGLRGWWTHHNWRLSSSAVLIVACTLNPSRTTLETKKKDDMVPSFRKLVISWGKKCCIMSTVRNYEDCNYPTGKLISQLAIIHGYGKNQEPPRCYLSRPLLPWPDLQTLCVR